jgi:hypothetical protein
MAAIGTEILFCPDLNALAALPGKAFFLRRSGVY